jgi:hydrogenase-4 component E
MSQMLDTVLIVALALNFCALGVSRIRAAIRAVAAQGVVLACCPLFIHPHLDTRGLALVVVGIAVKGFLLPRLLLRAMREADIQHEVKPVVGYPGSLFLGAVGTGLAMLFATQLPLAEGHAESLVVPASLATVWAGFLMLTTRKKAIMQVVGYLILENGIFLFGLLLLEAMPFLVEVGVLLDLFTGVFVMGIIIFHINREFSSISTEHLTGLKE